MTEGQPTVKDIFSSRYPSKDLTPSDKEKYMRDVFNMCEPDILEAAYRVQETYAQSRNGEPSIKDVSYDSIWKRCKGTQVDIVNTNFPDFPIDYQYDTADSIQAAVDAAELAQLFIASIEDPDIRSSALLEIVSGCVHEAFLGRRTFMGIEIPPDQDKSYNKLKEDIKEFDRYFARVGIEIYENRNLAR